MGKKIISKGMVILLMLVIASAFAVQLSNSTQKITAKTPEFLQVNSKWADSIVAQLSLEQQIAQLIMYPVYTNKDEKHIQYIESLVSKYGIGGVIFMQGGPVRQVKVYNRLQTKAKVPLFTSIDGEWGVSMRLDSAFKFPRQLMLGAITDMSLIEAFGREVAHQCKVTGVHINFAPDIDVNVNPNNPVINSRSFGESPERVAASGVAYMKGMQQNKVLACAKHFPGHGDTDSDSHYSLPVIKHGKERLKKVELYPFKALVDSGVGSVMIAHLYIPALDSTKNRASTLSPKIVQGMLKDSMGFKGLTFTDALNMKGVADYYSVGEVDVLAFLAGNDVLLFSQDVPKAIKGIKQAIKEGKTDSVTVAKRVWKVLMTKKWLGLDQVSALKLPTQNVAAQINRPEADVLNRRLIKEALTLLHNKDSLLPIRGLSKNPVTTLSIGLPHVSVFQKSMEQYAGVQQLNLPQNPTRTMMNNLFKSLDENEILVIGVHGNSWYPSKRYGISKETAEVVDEIISKHKKVVVALFANPYALAYFEKIHEATAVIVAYENSVLAQEYTAQLIMGGIPAKGKLPVSVAPHFTVGMGDLTFSTRLRYGIPEEEGMDSKVLKEIETIVAKGIEAKAFPGCQVLVAKNANVVYQQSFGHYTYEKKKAVNTKTLYDLASITKVAGSVPALMSLVNQGKLDLEYSLCDYLEDLEGTPYYNMNVRRMLAHTAGLASFIPFYAKTIHRGQLKFDVYSSVQTPLHQIQVAKDLYIRQDYQDSIKAWIYKHGVHTKKEYKYSDLGYYFYKDIVEKISGVSMDVLLDSLFYQPLGAHSLGYHPLKKFDLSEITPTENDMIFRKRLIHGFVHDPGAAMVGGVGGHAGLFSNANDLAKLFQLFLNWGTYGGETYLRPEVIKEFVKCQFCEEDNRRGAGFDRRSSGNAGPSCSCVSFQSFGHTGFTGTMVWADPDHELIYIFLSNRVYPDAENNKLLKMNIRTDIQEVVYKSIQQRNKKG